MLDWKTSRTDWKERISSRRAIKRQSLALDRRAWDGSLCVLTGSTVDPVSVLVVLRPDDARQLGSNRRFVIAHATHIALASI